MSTMRDSGPPRVESWPPRACAGGDTNLWFPIHGDGCAAAQRAQAIRVCRGCAARRHCAAYALPIEDLAGIWGAMSAKDRTALRNKQQQKEA